MNKIMLALAAFLSLSTLAVTDEGLVSYRLEGRTSRSTGLEFKIGYTLGTHEGRALRATQEVLLGTNPLSVDTASFTVPIRSIRTGDRTRDCHLRSSLGIRYQGSRFPRRHVCDSDDRMPTSGPDRIVFPNIEFTIDDWRSAHGINTLEIGVPELVYATGTWSIHGVTKLTRDLRGEREIPVRLVLLENGTLRVRGTYSLFIEDFDIVVKAAMAGLIRVDNEVRVELDFNLVPDQRIF